MLDDGQRLNELAEAYQDELLRVCYMILRDRGLAEDAVQETFLKAYKALPGFREESSPRTWLTRIAVNTCRDMRRRAWFRLTRLDDLPERSAPHDRNARDEAITVSAEIARLPDRLRTAVILYYYQDMTVEEVASTLGISRSSASERLKRGREKLRQALKGEYFDE